MKIEHKKVKNLGSLEKQNLINFLIPCFADNLDYPDTAYKNPEIETCILISEEDNLLGHAHITKRIVIYDGKKYLVGGVGDVAIVKEKRGEGLGTKLMLEVNKILAKDNYDLGVLFCHPGLDKFYTKSGWVKKEKGKIYFTSKGEESHESTVYLYPIKINGQDINVWNSENIFIGEGTW